MARQFEWDLDKAASNESKHGVSFEAATAVFDDVHALEWLDEDVQHEDRWRILGLTRSGILFVVYVERGSGSFYDEADPVIRIISARRATRHEQQGYYASHR
jgi:uncharacterized protein